MSIIIFTLSKRMSNYCFMISNETEYLGSAQLPRAEEARLVGKLKLYGVQTLHVYASHASRIMRRVSAKSIRLQTNINLVFSTSLFSFL